MVPKTVASWVCANAPTEKKAAKAADSMQGRYDVRFPRAGAPLFVAWARLMIGSVSFFIMAPPISDKRSPQDSQKKPLSSFATFRQAPPKIKMEICMYGHGRTLTPTMTATAGPISRPATGALVDWARKSPLKEATTMASTGKYRRQISAPRRPGRVIAGVVTARICLQAAATHAFRGGNPGSSDILPLPSL